MQDVEGICNDPRQNWGEETWRQPTIKDDEEVMYSECGRIVNNVDHRSHWFVITRTKGSSGPYFYSLLVKHGGGEERIEEYAIRTVIPSIGALDSDNRYLLLYALHALYRQGKLEGRNKTAETYRQAFTEGRLKKRKMPGRNAFKVWIEARMSAGEKYFEDKQPYPDVE